MGANTGAADLNQIVLLNRAGINQDFRLEQFEEAINKVFSNEKDKKSKLEDEIARLMTNGSIPLSIR